MIFDPKKGGSFFEPPPPPHLPQNLKKVGFKWGGGSGGVRTKNSLGDAFTVKGAKSSFEEIQIPAILLHCGFHACQLFNIPLDQFCLFLDSLFPAAM